MRRIKTKNKSQPKYFNLVQNSLTIRQNTEYLEMNLAYGRDNFIQTILLSFYYAS